LEEVSQAYDLACKVKDGWQQGQLMFWIWRAGGERAPGDRPGGHNDIPKCYQAMMEGDWQKAADEWDRIGCLYEQAMTLAAGDEPAQFQALAIFEQLGARPAAKALQEQMQLEEVKGIPRGPRPDTKANPEGLTAREMEILALLVEGLSNAEISRQLSIAMKTVDHHVSTVLAKLDVHSRLEAAAAAR
jgi:DNA-binding NarL/FixJ family response regulator